MRLPAERIAQLRAHGFRYWIYRTMPNDRRCPSWHFDLDGLTLAPDHPFWERHVTVGHPDCGCYIVAQHLRNGAVRLGGKLEKPLPYWWATI